MVIGETEVTKTESGTYTGVPSEQIRHAFYEYMYFDRIGHIRQRKCKLVPHAEWLADFVTEGLIDEMTAEISLNALESERNPAVRRYAEVSGMLEEPVRLSLVV